jgi:hypothetical protein
VRVLGWVKERKRIAKLLDESSYESNSCKENRGLLETYRSFTAKWDEESELAIIRKTRDACKELEGILARQEEVAIPEEDKQTFSLSTYLATIPFPKNPGQARLRGVLLGEYDDKPWDALERFSEELHAMSCAENYEELESARAMFKGVEVALEQGFLGRELKRNKKYYIVPMVMDSISRYLN